MGSKTCLCKWSKDQYVANLVELQAIVAKPRFVCTKCGRAARKKGYLCKPVRMAKPAVSRP